MLPHPDSLVLSAEARGRAGSRRRSLDNAHFAGGRSHADQE
jgi:hypothetical protein